MHRCIANGFFKLKGFFPTVDNSPVFPLNKRMAGTVMREITGSFYYINFTENLAYIKGVFEIITLLVHCNIQHKREDINGFSPY